MGNTSYWYSLNVRAAQKAKANVIIKILFSCRLIQNLFISVVIILRVAIQYSRIKHLGACLGYHNDLLCIHFLLTLSEWLSSIMLVINYKTLFSKNAMDAKIDVLLLSFLYSHILSIPSCSAWIYLIPRLDEQYLIKLPNN